MTKRDIYELIGYDEKFRYMLLSRLKQDCNYYLGYGNRSANVLWALDEKMHIYAMKMLYNSFSDSKKPEWISMQDIEAYEKEMI